MDGEVVGRCHLCEMPIYNTGWREPPPDYRACALCRYPPGHK